MEKMEGDVIDCLKWAKFGGKFIEVYRGPQEDNWIFNDGTDVKKLRRECRPLDYPDL